MTDTTNAIDEIDCKLSWLKDHKYYNIHIQPNLFGGTSVIKSWGSVVSGRGGRKIVFCESEAEVMKVIEDVRKKRQYRKYEAIKSGLKDDYPTEELLKLVKASDHKILIQLVRQGISINSRDSEGHTALKWAAYYNNFEIVEMLLKLGADPNIQSFKGGTALIEACWQGDVSIVKILLKAGANVHKRTDNSQTPLSLAILGKHLQVIEILLKAGAK